VLLQGKLERISSHDWTWMLETNLLGAVRTTTAFLSHMTERGSGHIINVVSFGGVHPGDSNTIPYDTGHAALAAFTEALAQQTRGTGVQVSLFCLSQKAPKIGQNTRTRGLGRWMGDGTPPEEGKQAVEQQASALIDGVHHPRFLIAGEPADMPALERRWGHIDTLATVT
jgi:short-subunit dehydrogenase